MAHNLSPKLPFFVVIGQVYLYAVYNMLDAVLFYNNCNTKIYVICECSVMGFLESTEIDQAKFIAIIFLLSGDVESNRGSTVPY